MGYTDKEEMLTILSRFSSGRQPGKVSPVVTRQQLLDMQEAVETVRVHPDVAAYSVDLVEKTRHLDQVVLGVSPRGNLALIRAAKALAAVKGRDYVIPDDIKALALPVLGHRMILRGSQRQRSSQIEELISGILEETPVPTEDWKKQKEE